MDLAPLCHICQDFMRQAERFMLADVDTKVIVLFSHHESWQDLQEAAESCPFCKTFKNDVENQSDEWPHRKRVPVPSFEDISCYTVGLFYDDEPIPSVVLHQNEMPIWTAGIRYRSLMISGTQNIVHIMYILTLQLDAIYGQPEHRFPQAIERISRWYKRCSSKHACKSRPAVTEIYPRRLLDVGSEAPFRSPRIMYPEKSVGNNLPYVTLSHCWVLQFLA